MRRRLVFFAVALPIALIVFLPLRLAAGWFGLGERGLAAREATGRLWSGAFAEAELGPVPIGDLRAGLDVLPLLLGRARLSLAGEDAAAVRGAVTVSRGAFGVDDVTGQLRAGALLAPLPVAAFDLDDISVRFIDGQCSRAEGNVRLTLAGEVAGIGLPSGLTGAASCADGAVAIPFVSQSGMERLELRLSPDGRTRADISIRPTDDAARARLTAAGFRDQGGLFVRRIESGSGR
jgi:general secretion pathway protein N